MAAHCNYYYCGMGDWGLINCAQRLRAPGVLGRPSPHSDGYGRRLPARHSPHFRIATHLQTSQHHCHWPIDRQPNVQVHASRANSGCTTCIRSPLVHLRGPDCKLQGAATRVHLGRWAEPAGAVESSALGY
eukprot:scaffold131904_cov36-Tisochrysis_lutea.AAC.5